MVSDGIIIITEAGNKIGLGHYTRCNAIRQELELLGIETKFLVYLNEVDLFDNNIINSNWISDLNILLEYRNYKTVIIDSYIANASVYIWLQTHYEKVIVIDDYNRIPYKAHLIINPNTYFYKLDYTNQTAICIGGKEYIILRSEFRAKHIPRINNHIENVLISIGGSDYRNILPIIIQACQEEKIRTITVISPEREKILKSDGSVKILPNQDAKSMRRYMIRADIVISGCGQVLHELASLGKSTIGIQIDKDQTLNQQFYLDQHFLQMDIKWDDDDLIGKIRSSINKYKSVVKRKRIASLSPKLIDKNGVLNIVNVIANDNG